MRYGFWNTKGNAINSFIAQFVMDYRLDCVILAEYQDNHDDLDKLLSDNNIEMSDLQYEMIGSKRITIFSDESRLSPGRQDKYYSISIVDEEYILCAIHLKSDMNGDASKERQREIDRILREINMLSSNRHIKKIIIVGDVNENPYDPASIAADEFHGSPSRIEAMRKSRIVDGEKYDFYYNPMWNLLGDMNGPPGTYYIGKAELNNPLWHMIDQVIISPSAIKDLQMEELHIVTEIGGESLCTDQGRPKKSISDHFPIIFEMKGE